MIYSPIQYAIKYNNIEIVKLLLDYAKETNINIDENIRHIKYIKNKKIEDLLKSYINSNNYDYY